MSISKWITLQLFSVFALVFLAGCGGQENEYFEEGKASEINGDEKDGARNFSRIKVGPNKFVHVGYFPNGEVKNYSESEQGKLNGVSRWFYENGTIQVEQEYRNDVSRGRSFTYFQNGKLQKYAVYDPEEAAPPRCIRKIEFDSLGNVMVDEKLLDRIEGVNYDWLLRESRFLPSYPVPEVVRNEILPESQRSRLGLW